MVRDRITPLTGPDQGEAQGIAGESRIAQGVLDGTAPASGPVNGGPVIPLSTYGPEYGYTLATGRLFCEFGLFQEWASDLVGRSLMTHQFADTAVWDEIREAFEADMTERYGR